MSENSPHDDFDEILDHETAEADVFDEPEEVVEDAAAAPPPQPAGQSGVPTGVAADDYDFVKRVFVQVKDVDFRTPPPPPPKGLSGPDKKMHDLREKVRRLERDLARVGYVWTHKQAEVDAIDTIINTKEAERQSAVTRYEKMKEAASRAAAEQRDAVERLNGELVVLHAAHDALQAQTQEMQSRHEEAAADLTRRLTQQEQEKAALLVDFRQKIEAAQTAFNSLREQSTRNSANLEAQLKARDENVTALDREGVQLKATLSERDLTIDTITREGAAMRAQLEKRITDLEGESARLSREIGGAQVELKQLQESYEKRGQEIDRLKQQLTSTA